MNKFAIKMSNGDVHIIEGNYTFKEISNRIEKLNVERGTITTNLKMLRLKYIVSIELINE